MIFHAVFKKFAQFFLYFTNVIGFSGSDYLFVNQFAIAVKRFELCIFGPGENNKIKVFYVTLKYHL